MRGPKRKSRGKWDSHNTNQEKYSSENNISYFLNCLENEKEHKNSEENFNNNYKIK
jgi:hypothetical protein